MSHLIDLIAKLGIQGGLGLLVGILIATHVDPRTTEGFVLLVLVTVVLVVVAAQITIALHRLMSGRRRVAGSRASEGTAAPPEPAPADPSADGSGQSPHRPSDS